jgi:hypothetical protein
MVTSAIAVEGNIVLGAEVGVGVLWGKRDCAKGMTHIIANMTANTAKTIHVFRRIIA